jgi:hypothetical protein
VLEIPFRVFCSKWLKIWIEHAKIAEGPIFRRVIGRDGIGGVLHPGSIAPIFKRVAHPSAP